MSDICHSRHCRYSPVAFPYCDCGAVKKHILAERLAGLTTERLAEILHDELAAESWGLIDPDWIKMVAEGNYAEDDAGHDEAEALGKVLDRVVARLKEES